MNAYDSCSMVTGVDRESVKKVLTWARYSGTPQLTYFGTMMEQVARFQQEIIGQTMPDKPTMLKPMRADYAEQHLQEELDEFKEAVDADDLPKAVDALQDLIYVAGGRLFEMGVMPGLPRDEVHRANISKVRGTVAKRAATSGGFDAIKPEGWKGPDFSEILKFGLEDFRVWQSISPVHVRLAELRAKKGNDYNTSVQLVDYFPFGHQSYVQMVYLKALRLVSLTEVTSQGREPNFESVEDTVLDLLNYATFYAEWLERVKMVKPYGAKLVENLTVSVKAEDGEKS